MGTFTDIVLLFTIYSMIGWLCECIFCSILEKKVINRGFLHGPYCPIYGFGAVLILVIMQPLHHSPILVFIGAVVLTTALEYLASWLMEKLFSIRWWDYSANRFNLHGRVCLQFSLLFGIMGISMVYIIHPTLLRLLGSIPGPYARVIGSVLVGLFLLDLIHTLNTLVDLEEKLRRLQAYIAELRQSGGESGWFDEKDLPASLERLRSLYYSRKLRLPDASLPRLESIGRLQLSLRRLMNSFPNMQHIRSGDTLRILRTGMQQRVLASKESWSRRLWAWTKQTGKNAISFAQGLNFYKLCWIFFVASFVGYVLETLYCLLTTGHIESRQGMLYGPFNQVYGFGAVLMTLLLHKLARKNDRWLFIGGAVIGGGFEFLCSLLQELAFGTVSWEYAGHAVFFGGRTSLLYMFFWGILAVVLIKGIYPRLSRLIERIPNRQGIFFTWVILVLLCINLALSAAAVSRWADRHSGIPPNNTIATYLDEKYPDSLMEEIYPNMQFVQ